MKSCSQFKCHHEELKTKQKSFCMLQDSSFSKVIWHILLLLSDTDTYFLYCISSSDVFANNDKLYCSPSSARRLTIWEKLFQVLADCWKAPKHQSSKETFSKTVLGSDRNLRRRIQGRRGGGVHSKSLSISIWSKIGENILRRWRTLACLALARL